MTAISPTRLLAPALLAALLAAGTVPPAEAGRLRIVQAHPGGGGSVATVAGRHGPHGGHAVRRGRTAVGPDGSATHAGRFTAANARGSIASSGTSSRDAQGHASASRQTTVTNAATGHSAQVSASYSRTDSGMSAQRTVSCHDAAGQAIACR